MAEILLSLDTVEREFQIWPDAIHGRFAGSSSVTSVNRRRRATAKPSPDAIGSRGASSLILRRCRRA
jgi:hypothetical protein